MLFSEGLLAPPVNSTKPFLLWRRHSEYNTVTDCVRPTEVYYNDGLLMLNTGSHVPVCIRWQCNASWESVFFSSSFFFFFFFSLSVLCLCFLHCFGVSTFFSSSLSLFYVAASSTASVDQHFFLLLSLFYVCCPHCFGV